MIQRRLACLSLAATLAATVLPAAPALADGAASTRNIILGGAAATLLIINHNRKVHQKYAEYDRRQASTQAAASNAQAAYQSERRAYAHEAALVQGYQHEVAVQHHEVVMLRRQLAQAQSRAHAQHVAAAAAQPAARPQVAAAPAARPAIQPLVAGARIERTRSAQPSRIANTASYGWGTL